jgi:inosose dehydratase
MKRRTFLALAVQPKPIQLAIGNYGMQDLDVDKALEQIHQIGYDGAELCLMQGWPTEPIKLNIPARRRIREQPLAIPSLIENFNLLVSDPDYARTLDRIRIAAALALDISEKNPPVLQTVLGGKPDDWDQVKSKMAIRLAGWARVAEENGIKLAVKSHIGSASNTPEKLIWLLDQVKSPVLSGIYDYSHFQLMGLDLEKTLSTLLPRSSFITVKDGRLVDGEPQFLLPGEGTTNYKKYFDLLKNKKYKGWMLVEISRQLQVQPNYDPIAAARKSYQKLAPFLI